MRDSNRLGEINYINNPKQIGPVGTEFTVWEDLRFPLMGRHIDVSRGTLDYDYANCGVKYQSNATYSSDPICFVVQMSHKKKLSTNASPHLHFIQSQNAVPNFLIEYRWYNNGDTVPSFSKAKYTDLIFTYSSGDLLQIVEFPELTPPSNECVSSILDIRLFRDTANSSGLFSGTDPYSGSVLTKEFDIHLRIDTIGSMQEYSKE